MSLHTLVSSLRHHGIRHRPPLPLFHCPPTPLDDLPLSLLRHQHHRHLSPRHFWISQCHSPRPSTLRSMYHLSNILQTHLVIEKALLVTGTLNRDHCPAVSHWTRQTRARTTGLAPHLTLSRASNHYGKRAESCRFRLAQVLLLFYRQERDHPLLNLLHPLFQVCPVHQPLVL